MSIKNDIEMVREELTSEEKFFEKSVITERFVKKYKNIIIGTVVLVVVVVSANVVYDMNKESTAVAANETLSELNKTPSDANAIARLKSLSPDLHDAFLYSKAIVDQDIKVIESLKNSQAILISDLAKYESINDASGLESYSLSQDATYKDLAQVRRAILLMNDGDVEKAHEKLRLISDASSLKQIAQALLHYGIK